MATSPKVTAHQIILQARDRFYKQAYANRFEKTKIVQTITSVPYFAEGRFFFLNKYAS